MTHSANHSSQGAGVNVAGAERFASLLGGAALVAYGLTRRSPAGMAMAAAGSGLLYRGASGHCPLYSSMGMSTAEDIEHNPDATIMHGEGVRVEHSAVIKRPREELFRFWRNLENLPRFMEHLESVTIQDATHSHWTARAPLGTHVSWDAEIINERENELIAWRSLEGASVPNAGSVTFEEAPDGDGTLVSVVMEYKPPVAKASAYIARLLGKEPDQQVMEDLARFKTVMESENGAAGG